MAPSINNTTLITLATPTTPSSTLVNIAEHAELRLIVLLADTATSSTFRADCESCIANAEAARLIRTIARDDGAVEGLFRVKTLSLNDAVSAFFLWAALLDRVDVKEQRQVAEEMADAVVKCGGTGTTGKGGKEDPRRRRRVVAMLCALYNLRTDATDKCRLLERIVRQNSTSSNTTNEEPQLIHDAERALERWDQDGVVPTNDRRNLLRALADSCGGSNNEGDNDTQQQQQQQEQRRQKFLLRLVHTYTDERECRTKEALEMAAQAAEGAIRDPVTLFAEQRGMLRMPAIVALKDKSAPLYNLLQIFQEAKLAEFQTFLTKHPKALSALTNTTTKEDCVRHMRILSLCSLAAEYGDEIPYDAVAETLDIASEDVESWVIAAVASGLLSAKMDQLQRVVMVERCVVRNFGPAQWRTMQAKIHAWKKNVKLVLDGLQQQEKQEQAQVQQLE